MLGLIVTFLALAAVVIVAAIFLANFADKIAEETGLGSGIVGLVLLAGATSLPEFSIGFSAIRMGAVDLTAGDVLGSSLINLLIISMIDLVWRIPGRILSKAAAAHALSANVACLLTALVLLGIVIKIPGSFLHIGYVSWAVLFAYVICARLLFLDQRISAAESAANAAAINSSDHPSVVTDRHSDPRNKFGLPLSIAGFVAAATVIFLVSPHLAHIADSLAEKSGLGRTFFGTVFVALMTSLPEAVATITACRLGKVDMAIGNILGSNTFNMTIFAILDIASPQPILNLVASTHIVTAACVIIATTAASLSLLYRSEKRWWFIEPDAALVAAIVLVGLFLVYLQR